MSTATASGSRAMPSVSTADPRGPAGLVLAGGASVRMGRDKAELEFGGRSLLAHAHERLVDAGAEPILVSGHRPGYDYIPDREPGRGPLGGIASILAACPELQGRILIVLPVDTPALAPDDLQRLAQHARSHPGAHFREHPLPVAMRVDRGLIRGLTDILEGTGPDSIQALNRECGFRAVDPDEADLRNINTPSDWKALLREAEAS